MDQEQKALVWQLVSQFGGTESIQRGQLVEDLVEIDVEDLQKFIEHLSKQAYRQALRDAVVLLAKQANEVAPDGH